MRSAEGAVKGKRAVKTSQQEVQKAPGLGAPAVYWNQPRPLWGGGIFSAEGGRYGRHDPIYSCRI